MKRAARLLFLAGAVAIALFFLRAAPRDVTLVYDVQGSGARSLEVDIEKAGVAVRRAEFRLPEGAPSQVSHRVRLTDGEYLLRLTVDAGGVARRLERPITVTESGTIVVPVGPP
jgi:hypothetical protein